MKKWKFMVLPLFVLLLVACAKKEKKAVPSGDWSPEVTLSMGQSYVKKPAENEGKLARIGTAVETGDALLTQMESKMEIRLNSHDVLVIGEDSKIILQKTVVDGQTTVVANLFFGKLFSRIKKITGGGKGTYRVVTPTATAAIRGTDFSVTVDPLTKKTVVMVAEGTVTLEDRKTGKRVDIPAGGFSAVEKGKDLKPSQSVETTQWDTLKSWVEEGSDIQILIPEASPQNPQHPPQESAPQAKTLKPAFRTSVLPDVSLGGELRTVLEAEDPEGKPLQFALLKGPEGFRVDSVSGQVTWVPKQSGNYSARIMISNGSETAVRNFQIQVKGGLEVSVRVSPAAGGTATDFFFDAVLGGIRPADSLLYAWDFENDGTLDLNFSPQSQATHRFNRSGRHPVRLIVKTALTTLSEAVAELNVNDPPVAVLKIQPSEALPGTVIKMDGSGSRDPSDPESAVKYRWDFNGDGKWDEPRSGYSAKMAQTSFVYAKAGEYKIVLEVADAQGALGRDSIIVRILGNVTAAAGEDISASVNASVSFKGAGRVPDGKIAKYEWDFNGDGKFDWSSPQTGETMTVYRKEGRFAACLKVTSAAGVTAVDSLWVTIANAPPRAFSDKSKKAIVNSAATFSGTGKDPDGKIVQYLWDFDGDKKTDFKSDSTGNAVFTYTRAGKFQALFKVVSNDGKPDSVWVAVEVTNRPPEAMAGEDVVSRKGKTVALKGQGKDEDGTIVKFEWDFEADGKYDWENVKSGEVKHKFEVYGNAVLRVTDADGAQDQDTVRIVICPKGMVTIEEQKLCIDQYEWPNKEGELPTSDIGWNQAQAACLQAGKRLCTAEEWSFACRGREERNFPYGYEFRKDACNTKGQIWSKNKRVNPSGKFPECRTPDGVWDMSGNVMEWTDSKAPDGTYARGGSFENPMDGADCTAQASENPDKGYFFVGFRCCK